MPKPTLILHVGPHKTGTTTLQFRLFNARAHLAAYGFDYPDFGVAQFAHHRIKAFLNNDAANAGDVNEARFCATFTGATNIVLSSEDFVYLSNDGLQRLSQLSSLYEIYPIIFLRNPIHLWPSHWQTLVNHGRDATLIEYLAACVGFNSVINGKTHHPLAFGRRFAHVFGPDRIRMFSYDAMRASKIDIFDFFLDKILAIPPATTSGRAVSLNTSAKSESTELIRCMNEQYLHANGKTTRGLIAPAFLRARADVEGWAEYEVFSEGFRKHGQLLTLDAESEVFRHREVMLIKAFGGRIENKAAADRIYPEAEPNDVLYCARYWAYRFGLSDFVSNVLASLHLPSQQHAAR